jgi:hypothetical protein
LLFLLFRDLVPSDNQPLTRFVRRADQNDKFHNTEFLFQHHEMLQFCVGCSAILAVLR